MRVSEAQMSFLYQRQGQAPSGIQAGQPIGCFIKRQFFFVYGVRGVVSDQNINDTFPYSLANGFHIIFRAQRGINLGQGVILLYQTVVPVQVMQTGFCCDFDAPFFSPGM